MRLTAAPLESDDRTSFRQLGNVVIACSHDQETPFTFGLLEKHLKHVAATEGGKAGLLFVVDHQKGPPPGFVERAGATLDRVGPALAASSSALLAEGFVASVYRSMAAMLLALVGRRHTFSAHGKLEDASTWLVARLPPGPSTPDPLELASEARKLLRGHATKG